MKKLIVLAVAALAATVATGTAEANHSWGGYHWARTSNPFTVKLGDNVTSDWDGYLATTSSDWSKSDVLDTTIVTGGTTGRKCRPTVGRVEVCNAYYGYNGWLGLASISITGGTHITQGTAKMNDSYFQLAKYNTPEERNHVMCQEVGHTFGLGHQDESGATLNTCMDYSTSPTSQHPNQHDYDQLALIYSHLDSTTTVGLSPVASNVPEWAAAWDHSTSVYVDHLANGDLLVTFVIWANPIHGHL